MSRRCYKVSVTCPAAKFKLCNLIYFEEGKYGRGMVRKVGYCDEATRLEATNEFIHSFIDHCILPTTHILSSP
jgi:hypothetical protein